MADNNKKKYIKYEDTTYILQDSRFPEPAAADNGKVLGVVNGAYALKQEQGGGSGAVDSVNGKTGAVVLDAEDVGALPDDTVIPAAVTEQDVARWGFTKNTGTYSKPSGGIPASDLASAVQTSLGKADTALQQHQSLSGYATETWVQNQGYGTYSKPSGGIPASDLASGVIPDVSGKLNTNQGAANAGKFLVVGSDGNIAPVAMSAWQGGSY